MSSVDFAKAGWHPAVYKTPGRYGYGIKGVIPHIGEGSNSRTSIRNTFQSGNRQASAHYGVDEWGWDQYVRETDYAWAVGEFYGNAQTISIELAGNTASPPTRACLDNAAELMADISRRYGLGKYVLGGNVSLHKWYSSTSCPATTDVDYLIDKANSLLGGKESEDMLTPYIIKPNGEDRLFYFDGIGFKYIPKPDCVLALQEQYSTLTGKDIPYWEWGTKEAPWPSRVEQVTRRDYESFAVRF